MDIIARRIVLPETDAAGRLPNVVKREVLDAHLESSSVLERAEARAESIVADARARAEAVRLGMEDERRGSEARGYRDGLERGRVEAAAELLALSDSASGFVADVEASLVATVLSAVREISARLDDAALVEATVERGLQVLGEGVRATLSVAVPLRAEVEMRLEEFPGAAAVSVIGDPRLHGADCRLESGRMVIVGDIDEQLEAMRVALEEGIALARARAPDQEAPGDAAGHRHPHGESRRESDGEHQQVNAEGLS